MKRYYYNNWLAKVLLMLSTCHTIALAWFVLSKRDESLTEQKSRNHETIHAMQWTELTMAVGCVLFFVVASCDLSLWWLALSPFVYYVWYVLEWLYKSISFEQEAYDNDDDSDYVENRHLFCGWIKRVLTIKL